MTTMRISTQSHYRVLLFILPFVFFAVNTSKITALATTCSRELELADVRANNIALNSLKVFASELNARNEKHVISQSRDLKKYPLASMYNQEQDRRAAKTKVKLDRVLTSLSKNYAGARVALVPIKSFESTKNKVDGDYSGDWKRVLDRVRASIGVCSLTELASVVRAFENEKSNLKLVLLKDRINHPLKSGYRDMAGIFYDEENNVYGEIQFHLVQILLKKEDVHANYEITREIERAAAVARRPLRVDEKIRIESLELQSKAIYTMAYADALARCNC